MSSASTNGTPKLSSASMKTSSPPASTEGMTIGTVTVQKVRPRDAPRFCAASSTEMSTALKAASVGRTTKGKSVNAKTTVMPVRP